VNERLTQAELAAALVPVDEWMAENAPADRVLDILTFTPKPGDRDLLLWITPGVAAIGILYVAAHLIVAAVTS
jgi:hypothetical protein